MYIAQTVKDRINNTIKNQKISASKLLSDCELNPNTINKISDKTGLSSFNLAKIADYLDVSVDYLLGRTEEPTCQSVSNSYNQNGDNNFQTVGTVTEISKRDAEILQKINSLDFNDYVDIINYINGKLKNAG